MHRLLPYLRCLTVALAILAGGCVYSEQPLSARADAKPDPRLAGTWLVQKDPDAKNSFDLVEAAHINFDAEGTGHLENFKDGERQGDAIAFFITRTPHGTYLNLNMVASGKEAKTAAGSISAHDVAYMIARYEISDDGKTLKYSMMDRDRFKDALVAGQLKGKLVENEQTSTSEIPGQSSKPESHPEKEIPLNDKEAITKANFYWVLLRDTPENILKFIDSTPEKEIFQGPVILKKVD